VTAVAVRILIPVPMYHPGAEALLATVGEVVRPGDLSRSSIAGAIADADVIIGTGVRVDRQLIAAAPRLRVIAQPSAGFDNVDLDAATEAGIPVVTCTGFDNNSVPEFTIGLMIALARHIVRADRALRESRDWDTVRDSLRRPPERLGRDLRGKTAAILGLGAIGRTVARMCQTGLQMRTIAYDPYVAPDLAASMDVALCPDVLSSARGADFLLVHLPLTDETRGVVDAEVLDALGVDGSLVNCARGGVVDEGAVLSALRAGRIAGAALDVVDAEPPGPDSPLYDAPSLILTPHIAGISYESAEVRGRSMAERVLAILDGDQPDEVLNPQVWKRRG